jgi:hypothetical protein
MSELKKKTEKKTNTKTNTKTTDLDLDITPKVLNLNEKQTKAIINIKKYIEHPLKDDFLLLGPAGAGKTTVIVNAFNGSNLKLCFCAFTNKATQVLKTIANKFSIDFQSDFMTIHKLLGLEIKYQDTEHEIAFTFDKNKVIGLAQYDVIIFDECSTISADLHKFLYEARDFIEFKFQKKLKYLFLGDYWQLPPVGEEKSVTFDTAIQNKWLVSKLEKVMRSANDDLRDINENMLSWIPRFKSDDADDFIKGYPYNLVARSKSRYLGLDAMLDRYIDVWQTKTPDTVILTYSKANCEKTNFAIQDRLDMAADRDIPAVRSLTRFYAGDRCCIDKPIEVYVVCEKQDKLSISKLPADRLQLDKDFDVLANGDIKLEDYVDEDVDKADINNAMYARDVREEADEVDVRDVGLGPEVKTIKPKADVKTESKNNTNVKDTTDKLRTVYLEGATGESLYNGEIFDVIKAEDVHINTTLNRFQYMPKFFEGQLLTIRRIADADKTYEILHIPEKAMADARKKIKAKERRMFYLNVMSDFIKKYPKLDYGYCITVYKSQGSEWNTVFVNLNSIKWSVVGKSTMGDLKKKIALFKTTYTALSRASDKLYCLWSC